MYEAKKSFWDIIKNPFISIWEYLWYKTDDDFKKMCFISSLHAKLKKCKESDLESLKNLNNEMRLVKDVNAMRLPILLGPIIWKKLTPLEIVSSNQDKFIQRVVRKVPCWLRYSKDEEMSNDVRMLLEYYG